MPVRWQAAAPDVEVRVSAPALVLLPPSKGKTDGGGTPRFGGTLRRRHPLKAPRREVLSAVLADVAHLDDAALARVAGVASRDVAATRATLADLDAAPTLPAHRRYTGVVHGDAGLADLPADRRDDAAVVLRIVSPLLGLVGPDEPVPAYRLELGARLPSIGGLGPFWREAAAAHLAELGDGRRVWDLLPGEHRRIWRDDVRAALDVVDVRFVRPDGRAANAARTKVAKGRLAAVLLAEPDLDPTGLIDRADLDAGWTLSRDDGGVLATYHG